MNTEAIQKLIDAEKPAFDYARMYITTIAWWTVLLFVTRALLEVNKVGWMMLIIAPVLTVGALFGAFLAFRLNLLTERVANIMLDNVGGIPKLVRPLFQIVIMLLPLTSAWLLIWALMFAKVG